MSNPQQPYGPNPYGGGHQFNGFPGAPPVFTAPPPMRPRANTFATLSVVFAFVFAPVGALFGHLGLRQIRRTGQAGRDRAIVGLILSYAVITLAVVALIAWLTRPDDNPVRTAAPSTTTAPATTGATARMVTPSGLPGLLPSLADVERFVDDPALVALPPSYQLAPASDSSAVDRPECWPVMGGGAPDTDMQALIGYYEQVLKDASNAPAIREAGQSLMAFRDAAGAQRQYANLVSIWRRCGGSTMNILPPPGKQDKPVLVSMSVPADAGNGITTMVLTAQGPLMRSRNDRAIAVKGNVVADINVVLVDTDRGQQAVLDIVNAILGKIPG